MVTGSLIYFVATSHDGGHVNAARILAASRTYADGLRAQAAPVPATVSLQDLVDRGLLAEADVAGFAGLDLNVSLAVDETRPQEVLIRARLPDGQEVVALADGSVQQLRR